MNAPKTTNSNRHWIKVGHIGSAKGLDGRFLLQLSPCLNSNSLPQFGLARIGSKPDIGVPARILKMQVCDDGAIEVQLNNLNSPEDVSQFMRQDFFIEKTHLKLENPEEIHVSELIGKNVVYKTHGIAAGVILDVVYYGASFVAVMRGSEGTIELPIVPEYFDYKDIYQTGFVFLLKDPSDIQELWEPNSP